MTAKQKKSTPASGAGIAILAAVALAILFIAITSNALLALALLFVGAVSLSYCLIKSPELRTLLGQATTMVFASISQIIRERRARQAESKLAVTDAKKRAKTTQVKPAPKPKPVKREQII